MARAEDRLIPSFVAPYAADDGGLLREYVRETALDPAREAAIDRRASRLIAAIRAASEPIGGLEDFLREYGLSTPEGLALMVLAEALLRIPDAVTQDRLIEDRLGGAAWREHGGHGEKWLLSAWTWALGVSSRLVRHQDTPEGLLAGLVRRLGAPAVRTAVRQAMRFLGHRFVVGESIDEALRRARPLEARGFRFSFDMLGEAARTAADARRYADAYAAAIEAIGSTAGDTPLPARRGVSVKLSALHPRYEPLQRERVLRELGARLLDLARMARAHDLNFTIDAEEADRLELSLELFSGLVRDPALRGWEGLGLAVQAYQKRAASVVDWLIECAAATGNRFMIRLVKGAYWDTEIKRAQERGLPDYPVFTRKPATDISYLACARRLLAARPRIFPQFATHNALTVATILEMAGGTSGFEFQRLHGMGEDLYEALRRDDPSIGCRIYAPVGVYRDLLAYLVRRLLENGANSAFVAAVGDRSVPLEELLVRPAARLARGGARHARIPLPPDLFATSRRNSAGFEFGDSAALEALRNGVANAKPPVAATPLLAGLPVAGEPRPVRNPANGETIGVVLETPPSLAPAIFGKASDGFRRWSATAAEERAVVLDRAAGMLENERDFLVALLIREGGKTVVDCIGEWREAIDFCRYYAAEARRLFGAATILPGPTGEENALRYRPRGVFAAISPWNFPLSIFVGQVAAALAAGNAVVAKPAEQTPLTAFAAVRLLHRAGIPEDVLLFAPGAGEVGAALVGEPVCAGVVFTGSTDTAWRINRALAARDGPIVPLIAETGGINAMIVDATALPEQVADDAVESAFRSAGQRCSALRLIFLQEDVADEMLAMIEGAARELKPGDPADFATDIGPIIDADAMAALQRHVAAMRAASYAKVRYAGELPANLPAGGNFLAPHIIELDCAARLSSEVFGPVLHVVRWKADELDAIVDAIAASGFALTLGIHSRVGETASRIAARLPVGNVYVNRSMIGAVVGVQPFGGSGLSGTGPKAGGPDYLRRFAVEQTISTDTAAVGGNASLVAMRDE